MINELFFDLIRVAVGTQDCLSHTPTADEWGKLYDMAKKQSLVGVCFAGVQKLVVQQAEPPEMLYLTWMGMAAKIQQRNEVVNRQCVELQARLSDDGFRSCIMKGQSNHANYGELSMLRQSGDIDVWLDGSQDDILCYVQKVAPTEDVNEMHAHLHVFEDTDVEVHFVPTRLANRFANKKLREWLDSNREEQFQNELRLSDGGLIISPTNEFNLVYQLIHVYRHLFSEGIGLRQVMDYYFLVSTFNILDERIESVKQAVSMLGLNNFASSLMWVLQWVFHMDTTMVPWVPNRRDGEFLLNEIMQMGNFERQDDRFKLDDKDSHLKRFCQSNLSKWRFLHNFPSEVVWQPIDMFLRFFEIKAMRKKGAALKEGC